MSGDGERDTFFHCLDRVPSGIHLDADFPSDEDDDDDEDVRVSFASAMGDHNVHSFRRYQAAVLEEDEEEEVVEAEDPSQYDMWMSDDHMSIQERRHRLHQGLGMASSRDLALRRHSMKKRPADVPRGVSRRLQPPPSPTPPTGSDEAPPSAAATTTPAAAALQPAKAITRRHSDCSLSVRHGGASGSGKPPPSSSQPLRRVRSLPARHAACDSAPLEKAARELAVAHPPATSADKSNKGDGKNGGDDGANKKEGSGGKDVAAVVVAASSKTDASSNTPPSGVPGLDEIEKFIGNTPIMKHLVRRGGSQHQQTPPAASGAPPKAEKSGGKKKGGWLKNIKSVAIGFIQDKDKDTAAKSSASSATTAAPKSAATNAAGSSSAGAPGASSSSSSERLKVHQSGKSSKELTGLYMCQEIQAHEGSIWSIKFSTDGRRLASAGEDRVVRVWQVVETSAPPSFLQAQDGSSPGTADGGASAAPALAQLSKKSVKGKSGRDTLPEHLVVPDKMFALAEQPACVLEGHDDDVLDLTWAKSDQQLLSSSMDKTVRLWDTENHVCLKTFTHNDYVTCIHFNPVDDRYFISGSLDAKVRLWSIPNRQVVDWTDLNEMVTAASYTPDGQGAIIGSHKGSCRLYKTTDCKLQQEAQIDIQAKNKRSKSQEKKITGFQFSPGNPSEVLVTSADSQIRVFDGVTMIQKFRGYKNTSSQISAAYTSDGRYAVCASEDSHVYLWRTTRVAPASAAMGIGMKPKTWCTIRSYENFFCKDVSAAVPWPHTPSPPGDSPSSSSRDKPPQQGLSCTEESCSMATHGAATNNPDGGGGGGKSGELSSSGAPLTHSGELSSSTRPGGGGGGKGDSGNAWGLVVVAASLGGEIRVYQNFGMPFRIRGQGNLFG